MSRSSVNKAWSLRSPHYPLISDAGARFEVLGRIAVGGMAEVLLARDREGNAGEVVIKRLLPSLATDHELVAMFLDEARLGMRLSHPNVCKFYDAGELDGQHWIAMEHIDGITLEQLIRRAHVDGGMPPALGVWIVAQVAAALAYVHTARDERGDRLDIVHRDISPRNVMVSWDGEVKLVDFGLARSRANRVVTGPGLAKGKFSYMSPEQYQGLPLDGRTDIFGLGVCLFELLTTTRLYRLATPLDTMNAIVSGPVPSLRSRDPHLPRALDEIVRRALAKRPEDRYGSAGDFETTLEHWLAEHSPGMNAERVAEHLADLFHEERSRGPELGPADFSIGDRGPAARALPSPLPPRPRAPIAIPMIAGAAAVIVGVAAAIGISRAANPAAELAPQERVVIEATSPEPETPAPAAPLAEAPPAPPVAVEPPVDVEPPAADPTPAAPAIVAHPAPASAGTGTLSINTRPWSEVYLDGELLGMTPLGDIPVRAGTLDLVLVDREGRTHHHTLTIPRDGHQSVFLPL